MCSSLRLLVVTSFYFLILLGLAACAKESVKPPDTTTGPIKIGEETLKLPPPPEKSLCQLFAESEGPPPNSFLRINTEMHTTKINRIAVDAKGQYLVTGSDDKTARVWSLPDGKLSRVLWPPIGEGDEGRIDAVALSPDGETVAMGGWTGCDKNGNNCSIYLFNRSTGELQHPLTGLPSGIAHLAYSTEGRYLVASLGGPNGIRIYDTSNHALAAQDTNYGADSYWAEFDREGRLVTSSFDGFIRLYDPQFKLLAKQPAPGGKQPFAVRFSPDGQKIAVGFHDTTQINVLSGQDLTLLYRPSTQGVEDGNLMSVAWLTEGNQQVPGLVAGGRYVDKGTDMTPILHWTNTGQGIRSQWASRASNTIMDIRALPDGQIVFGAGDPAFGVLSAQGKQQGLPRRAEIADFRRIFESSFRLSANGDQIQFGYQYGGQQPAVFAIQTRTLKLSVTSADLSPPRMTASGLKIDWFDTTAPQLNGKRLSLKQYETSRSLAIAPDGQRFLLGTDWYLRLFNQQGQQQWAIPVPGTAWGVNIAGNGKVAVAALGDGTIRWYRLEDGQEILAFFPHNDQKRWVLWTPQGYYDASPGAENLVGWHINQGPDKEAEFCPLGQSKEKNRPEKLRL